MSLEEQTASRKERLAQLRGVKRKAEESGRNYDKETGNAKLGYENPPVQETAEKEAGEIEKATVTTLADTVAGDSKLNLHNLRPKKPTWDLERDLEPKFKILETRTDNAIIRIVRERLKGSKLKVNDT